MQDWSESLEAAYLYLLVHIELCRNLFLPTELHHQVLVTSLPLSDGCTETKLVFDVSTGTQRIKVIYSQ